MSERIVVAVTGNKGLFFGKQLIEYIFEENHAPHVIVSDEAKEALGRRSVGWLQQIESMATECYNYGNVGASVASGSFDTSGMIIAPCSLDMVGKVANGRAGDLISRAADVTLKERRKLVVAPPASPLGKIHVENFARITDAGGIVYPVVCPGIDSHPEGDLTGCALTRILGLLGLTSDKSRPNLLKNRRTVDAEE